jgi:hypothetical protein
MEGGDVKGRRKRKRRKVKGECRVIERMRQGDGVGSGQRC